MSRSATMPVKLHSRETDSNPVFAIRGSMAHLSGRYTLGGERCESPLRLRARVLKKMVRKVGNLPSRYGCVASVALA